VVYRLHFAGQVPAEPLIQRQMTSVHQVKRPIGTDQFQGLHDQFDDIEIISYDSNLHEFLSEAVLQ
jgi:hypothetical protein